MQRELSLNDMTFGVFPALKEGFSFPAYESVGEVFDVVTQLLVGIDFLHRNLIAHLDIAPDNILINYAGTAWTQNLFEGESFRSAFPIRYMFIDFELSVRFASDSKPEERVVLGLPTKSRRGHGFPENYGREFAPEFLSNKPSILEFSGRPYDYEVSEKPYDPFKVDIWQLGLLLYAEFNGLKSTFPPLTQVFESMMNDEPSARLTAAEALASVKAYKNTLTVAQLGHIVPPADDGFWSLCGTDEEEDAERSDRRARMAKREEIMARRKVEENVRGLDTSISN